MIQEEDVYTFFFGKIKRAQRFWSNLILGSKSVKTPCDNFQNFGSRHSQCFAGVAGAGQQPCIQRAGTTPQNRKNCNDFKMLLGLGVCPITVQSDRYTCGSFLTWNFWPQKKIKSLFRHIVWKWDIIINRKKHVEKPCFKIWHSQAFIEVFILSPILLKSPRLPSHNRMKNFRIIIETCQDIMRGHHRLFASLLISKKFLLLRHLYLGCQLNIHSIDICKKNPQNQINIPTHQKQNSANSRVARGQQTWDTLSRSKIRMWWTMCVSEKKSLKTTALKIWLVWKKVLKKSHGHHLSPRLLANPLV